MGRPQPLILRPAFLCLFGIGILSALTLFPLLPGALKADAQAAGHQLYEAHCASCHGSSLEGQPNWMVRMENGRLPAPPHDASGHTWHHSDQQLFKTVRDGLASIVPGYETDMPAFSGTLTDEQITAVIDYIKSTWPARQKEIQAARTKVDTLD